MGNSKSKQKKQIKPLAKNSQPKPIVTNQIQTRHSKPTTKYKSSKKLLKKLPQRNKLYNPNSIRPLELSWLHQNNTNNNYNRITQRYHTVHHHKHEHRIKIAINRWPKVENEFKKSKPKSFVEQYIRQKH